MTGCRGGDSGHAPRAGEIRTRVSPSMAAGTGRGVRIAVIDSGVHSDHPHVAGVAGGVALDERGRDSEDFIDRLGHGTAVAAAIKEKRRRPSSMR